MKTIKKLTALLVSVLLVMTSFGVMAADISVALSGSHYNKPAADLINTGSGRTIAANMTIPQDGTYAIYADVSSMWDEATGTATSSMVTLSYDNMAKEVIGEVTVQSPGDGGDGYGAYIEDMKLAVGDFTTDRTAFYITKWGSPSIRIKDVKLKLLVKSELNSAKIGSEDYIEGTAYARGTDSISLIYDGDINPDTLTGFALEDSDGGEIGVAASLDESDSKKIIVSLKDSLDYSKSYTLTASGIKDSNDFTLDDVSLSFSTPDELAEDNGTDTAYIDSFSVTDGVATVSGTVKGSTGVGISGRKVDFYLTLPEESQILAQSTLSGDNGAYELSYTLENDDIAGEVSAEIKAEYAEERASKTCYYVSANRLIPIFTDLSGTTQGSGIDNPLSVEYVLNQNKLNLGIDPEVDLAGIDASAVYAMLKGADVETIEEFHNLYKFCIALENINEATDTDGIEAVIGNDDSVALLGLDTAKLSVLDGSGTAKLYEEILAFDPITDKETLNRQFDIAFNTALKTQLGIDDIALEADSDSAKQGAELAIDIVSTKAYSNIKEIVLDISFEDALEDEADDIDFTTDIGHCTVDADDDTAKVTIEVSDPEESITEIGVLGFTGSALGEGKVVVSGFATVSTGTDYDVSVAVSEKKYSVTINEQKKDKVNRGGGFSGGGSVGSSTSIPTVTAPVVTPVSQETFSDLSDVIWAQEAIQALLKRHSIAMNEEKLFYPNRNITRAEFIKMVVLAKDMYIGSHTTEEFDDVSEGDWYYQYVLAAINHNLIKGDGNGSFRPNDPITREDICVILARIGISGVDIEATTLFGDDASISDYARESVYVMKEAGIVNGIGGNLFAPKANTTRAMAAKLIYGFIK